ncbi:GTP 3',8-cyclase MoaA [Cupriavidus metallidurans]|uniref:GTP 3',8-cyclase n=1 Tax=Cupriavidus metallidurans TaxID=119219 RepID=A0A482IY99_9BURK|nr:GTP 3',8-cyclase MoaA [Cupriavidus metallidurans]QBP12533.1 GTP 3',8-cyclase MoaA [Cupriavidus metallidurans]
MQERIAPLIDARAAGRQLIVPTRRTPPTGEPRDKLQRPLRDLRISVTDRCNFRCNYCMPKEVFDKRYKYLPHSSLLTFEEIARIAAAFSQHGVRKIRLTGGEPLLRKNLDRLVEQLAQLSTPAGNPLELTLTTNASLLATKAAELKAAGLSRVNISLDALDDATFRRMNDVGFPVSKVLAGIEAAQTVGFSRIKVNMVVKRGTNDHEVIPMARYFYGTGVTLRFIEYMDVGATNGWLMSEVLPSSEVISRIQATLPLVPLPPANDGETAVRWGYTDGAGRYDPALGEIGVISSVTRAFCGDCNRIRLSTDGKLYLCLYASQGWDLTRLLRAGKSDVDLAAAIATLWEQRSDRYSELRGMTGPAIEKTARRIEMSYIGG